MDWRGQSTKCRIASKATGIIPTQSAVSLVAFLPNLQQPTYLYKHLVQFHECNSLSQTFKAPITEDQLVVPLHFLQLSLWRIKPAFRTEDIRIWTEDNGAAMDSPNGVSTCHNQLVNTIVSPRWKFYPISVPPGRNTSLNVSPSDGTNL